MVARMLTSWSTMEKVREKCGHGQGPVRTQFKVFCVATCARKNIQNWREKSAAPLCTNCIANLVRWVQMPTGMLYTMNFQPPATPDSEIPGGAQRKWSHYVMQPRPEATLPVRRKQSVKPQSLKLASTILLQLEFERPLMPSGQFRQSVDTFLILWHVACRWLGSSWPGSAKRSRQLLVMEAAFQRAKFGEK